MNSLHSDTESNVSGFVRYSDESLKELYSLAVEGLTVINQDVLEIERNLKSIAKQSGFMEKQMTALLQALPKPDFDMSMNTSNWMEDSAECPKQNSFYVPPKETIDYAKIKPESRRLDLRRNRLISIQGSIPSLLKHDSHENCGNFTTTSDLIYNHLPRPLCGPNFRRYKRAEHSYENKPELIQCFGNLTEFGLQTYKKSVWKCETVGDRDTSVYFDTYVRPNRHEYLQPCERKARDASFTKTFRYTMTKSKT